MAHRRKRAPKSWARVIEIKAKLGRNGATRPQMVASVREKYPEIVRAENDDLVYLGLMAIVNGVCNLKGNAGSSVQPDLFPGYGVPSTIALRETDAASGDSKNVEKNFELITKAEFRQYLADHPAIQPKRSKRSLELMRFFEAIKNHGGENWTVKQCWEAAQAQSKRRKR